MLHYNINLQDSMSREDTLPGETALTIGTSIIGSLFSHVFCCGLLPFALNAGASALLGGIGAQIGIAIVTTLAVATGVTFYEKHRHETKCASDGSCGCSHKFNFAKHFTRNLIIGICTYSFFATLTHLQAVHALLERTIGL